MSFYAVRKFTETVYDLFVVHKIAFPEVLKILTKSSDWKLRHTANYICSELEKGSLLSEALLCCDSVHFDSVYVMFIKFAEKTGDLSGVITFLKNRCDRKKQNMQQLIEAAVYPIFVIIIAIVLIIFFLLFGKNFFTTFDFQSSDALESFVKDVFCLLLVCCLITFFFWKNLKENRLYEAFLGMGFLIKAGINISLVVGYGMLMVGPDSRYGKIFAEAQKKLEYGMDLRASFGFSDGGGRIFSFGMDKKISDFFYFAQTSGNKTDVFEKVANSMGMLDERKRKFCFLLIEPVLIVITGIFLLLLIVNFLLPLFLNTNLI